jgi:xylulose-5-phosphate/fructose-6-phosphate phosphoketolase
VIDVAERVPRLAPRAAEIRKAMQKKIAEHGEYIRTHGEDMPEIRDWRWGR